MRRFLVFMPLVALGLAACGGTTATDTAGAPRDFCDAAVELFDASQDNTAGGSEGVDPASVETDANDAQALNRLFEQLGVAAPEIAESAPDEIKPQAETFAEKLPELKKIMESVNYDTTKLSTQQQAALRDEDFTSSLQTVLVYMTEHCSSVRERLEPTTPPSPIPAE